MITLILFSHRNKVNSEFYFYRKCGGMWSWLPWSPNSKSSPEARLIEQFKAIPSNASPKRLVRKYLEFCWSLPYYGSAFFRGQIETPAKSLTSLVINQDTEVIIAINSLGLHVIDPTNVVSDFSDLRFLL